MAIRFQRFRSPAGFTAIELVVAITIVCLLVAVALATRDGAVGEHQLAAR